jgi:hypothetical protein
MLVHARLACARSHLALVRTRRLRPGGRPHACRRPRPIDRGTPSSAQRRRLRGNPIDRGVVTQGPQLLCRPLDERGIQENATLYAEKSPG